MISNLQMFICGLRLIFLYIRILFWWWWVWPKSRLFHNNMLNGPPNNIYVHVFWWHETQTYGDREVVLSSPPHLNSDTGLFWAEDWSVSSGTILFIFEISYLNKQNTTLKHNHFNCCPPIFPRHHRFICTKFIKVFYVLGTYRKNIIPSTCDNLTTVYEPSSRNAHQNSFLSGNVLW